MITAVLTLTSANGRFERMHGCMKDAFYFFGDPPEGGESGIHACIRSHMRLLRLWSGQSLSPPSLLVLEDDADVDEPLMLSFLADVKRAEACRSRALFLPGGSITPGMICGEAGAWHKVSRFGGTQAVCYPAAMLAGGGFDEDPLRFASMEEYVLWLCRRSRHEVWRYKQDAVKTTGGYSFILKKRMTPRSMWETQRTAPASTEDAT
jgi:hypothetical protein